MYHYIYINSKLFFMCTGKYSKLFLIHLYIYIYIYKKYVELIFKKMQKYL